MNKYDYVSQSYCFACKTICTPCLVCISFAVVSNNLIQAQDNSTNKTTPHNEIYQPIILIM